MASTHLSECLALYMYDVNVSDAQLRAMLEDAHARDVAEGRKAFAGVAEAAAAEAVRPEVLADAVMGRLLPVLELTETLSKGVGLLNQLDDLRRDQLHLVNEDLARLSSRADAADAALEALGHRVEAATRARLAPVQGGDAA